MSALRRMMVLFVVGMLCAPAWGDPSIAPPGSTLPPGGPAGPTPPGNPGNTVSPNYVGLPAGYRMNDYVDIGGAEGGHGIVQGGPNGWGPIEPATSGGSWGGGTDTARVVWEPGGDRSGSLTLDFGAQQGVDKFLALRWLDGLADDSFEFTVADAFGHVSGGWLNNGSAGHPEAWFDLVSWNVGEMWGVSTVTITATGPQWALWGTYGQVAFSEAAAYTVPSPAAALLITLGLGLAGWVKRRIS